MIPRSLPVNWPEIYEEAQVFAYAVVQEYWITSALEIMSAEAL
jgi:hypothetical protein